MKAQKMGTVTVELTVREFELLAAAKFYWDELVLPNRRENKTVRQVKEVLDQFWSEYEKAPF